MEDILDLYEQPFDESLPVICMDEKPIQLLGDVRETIPMKTGNTSSLLTMFFDLSRFMFITESC